MTATLKRLFILFFAWALAVQGAALASKSTALMLNIDGAIGPATQDYVREGLEKAIKDQDAFVILKLNTPGGLDVAMRGIIQDILSSPLPVIVYVAPHGARAASAGTYILYASHVAAMAPATNLGAATPVSIDIMGELQQGEKAAEKTPQEKKALNDAIAYIKGLAELRGRNVEWAEKAVIRGESLQASEALRLGVIEIIAPDVADLLTQLNGRTVKVKDGEVTLQTEDTQVEVYEQDWRLEFLSIITDPSVAYLLLIIGIWGLFFEFLNPGYVLPGVAGTIAILLGLYAFQMLPLHYAGLALTIAGLLFMVSELFVPSYGALGGGGLIAFFIGSILLLDMEGYNTPWGLIVGMTFGSAGFLLFALAFIFKASRRKIVSGVEALLGAEGVAQSNFADTGWIRIEGELWKAHTQSPLKKGQHVEVTACKGLELTVKPKGD